MNKKILALILACVLLMGGVIGGTLAWLIDTTGTVTNTFTVGDVEITLTEDNGDVKENDMKNYSENVVPGSALMKDAEVTVEEGSETCYVFVIATEENNTIKGLDGKVIQWSIDSTNWIPLEGYSNVWYKENVTAGTSLDIIGNDEVTVNENLTKGQATENPSIQFKAAAVQSANVASASAAWEKLPSDFTDAATQTTA